ncbi:heavy metal translocating P-type ATPase [Coraliomargarita sp. SDUM461004]|uniref:Heavy metal translocating P-type ATPase n=1 Tax=Thalassobacterium sedimentorum TaxID=3041258 RepID=A0ABU1AHA8_9BACT|nr:heavy metal translocating P-type ATPase [Coraliomargarita sp. SDUM461004]MDQ8194201.1 heavy metal translocating P-type ATPase [Coraliomargarita sp. SDUM461004]
MSLNPESTSSKPTIVCRREDDCDDLDLKLSRAWLRIAIAGVFAGQGMVFSLALNMTPPPYASVAYWILHGGLIFSALVVMAFLGGPLFVSTFGMIRRRHLSIEGLFTVSLLGAFVGSVVGSISGRGSVYYEIVAIVIAIYTFGRMLGERSHSQLRLESARLRERFDEALVQLEEGGWELRPVAQVAPGARVRVVPGAAFTLDGIICSGVGYVQETALTGEPLPVVRRVGDRVRAGTWAVDSSFEVLVARGKGVRELDGILQAVEAADGRPSDLQTQANDLIRVFLPVVVGVSLATAIVWSCMGLWMDAILNSMTVLLVACPCALGLATPVAISQGLFRLAQLGLVSRDGAFIDALARTQRIFFDKTGTLSESTLRVAELWLAPNLPIEKERLLASVLEVESSLKHPVARALVNYLDAQSSKVAVKTAGLRTLAGQGIAFELDWTPSPLAIRVGEANLAKSDACIEAVVGQLHETGGRRVFVYVGEQVVACFVLQEQIRDGVKQLWQQLQDLQISAQVLTGDPLPELLLPDSVVIQSGLSSADKEKCVGEAKQSGQYPLFVGDGINDAVAMAQAEGSIAMHSGTGLARSVAMAQLTGDQLEIIPQAIRIARDIHRRLRGNLIYAVAYNLVGIILAAGGLLHPVAAALIMLVSSFWVTTRALRKYAV